ncbi:MAG: DUF2721 domain-containing protein [Thermoanaerobaculia bacterium]
MDLPIPAAGPLLAAMVTPAVLISAAGTLVFSTTSRLARIVDRARALGRELEEIENSPDAPFADEKRREIERQFAVRAERSRLVQRAVTGFYVALGMFVATTVLIGLGSLLAIQPFLPSSFAIVGTLVLFFGCIELIRETRLALKANDREMEFVLHLQRLRRERHLLGEARGDAPVLQPASRPQS